MPFTVDHRADDVLAWTATAGGATAERVTDYAPTIAVEAADGPLAEVESFLASHPRVVATRVESWRPGFRADPESVVRADLAHVDDVRRVAWAVRDRGPPGAFRCHDVDLLPEFRFCLERGHSPVPAGPLRALSVSAEPLDLREAPLTSVTLGGGRVVPTAAVAADASHTAPGLPEPPSGADRA
ncbi:MAG: hypothetical protein ABEJ42_00360, partial [Halobacteriaceae archaeon]